MPAISNDVEYKNFEEGPQGPWQTHEGAELTPTQSAAEIGPKEVTAAMEVATSFLFTLSGC